MLHNPQEEPYKIQQLNLVGVCFVCIIVLLDSVLLLIHQVPPEIYISKNSLFSHNEKSSCSIILLKLHIKSNLYLTTLFPGYYLYANGELGADNTKAVLVTNQVFARPSFYGFCMSYNYYMYGANMGKMTLYYIDETSGERYDVLWHIQYFSSQHSIFHAILLEHDIGIWR